MNKLIEQLIGKNHQQEFLFDNYSFVLPFLQLHRILKGKTLLGKD